MKTLCELKRKDIARHFDAALAALREAEDTATGYLCRDCLRFSSDKKRLCEPVSLKKLKHEPESSAVQESS
jgi:hypothetical protein